MKTIHIPFRALAHHDRLDDLVAAIGDRRIVLLGEASHGTSEYYTWRSRLSRRLIEEKGFRFIAVEGDWPDCYEINRYVKGWSNHATPRQALLTYDRWPTWMWANWEMVALVDWLRRHNSQVPEEAKVGFYGLDVYSLWESLEMVVRHFADAHPDVLPWAEAAMRCFAPFERAGQHYALHTRYGLGDCREEALGMLAALRQAPVRHPDDPEAHFNAEQNARVTVEAERYYRAMVRADSDSWNIRDRHMVGTLDSLMNRYGDGAKAIVWEHNTHVGDARATDMAHAGMVNVGQLVRESRGDDDVFIVGFGTFRGAVIAAERWGAPMQQMVVPPAMAGSWEEALHRMGANDRILFSSELGDIADLQRPVGHRAIGVVYDADHERQGNYVPTVIPRRYDAFVFLDETSALHPLKLEVQASHEPPDTYPWGI